MILISTNFGAQNLVLFCKNINRSDPGRRALRFFRDLPNRGRVWRLCIVL